MGLINESVAWEVKEGDNGPIQLLRTLPSFSGNLLQGVEWDYLSATYPTTSSEVYTFKKGGSSGVTTAVIEINYTDNSKANIDTVERTT